MKENGPRELLDKHMESLGLREPFCFENDNDLFRDGIKGASLPSTVVFLPKSKALIDMTLLLVSGMVAEGGTIVLAGGNDAGIRSAKDAYERSIGPIDQKIVGNHSALYVGRNARLGAGKTWRDFLSFSPIAHGGAEIQTAVLPGVFSAGELDPGTKLLLDHIPFDRAKILDVGCGSGIIGALYKTKNPASDITMTDSSALAVKAAEETLKRNSLDGRVLLADVFSGVTGAFDLIITNPPFHTGVRTDYSFIERFARGAKKYLNRGGEAWVVANSFLPYKEVLEKNIGPTETVIDNGKFAVYRSRA